MKSSKKWLALVLAGTLALGIAGCGGETKKDKQEITVYAGMLEEYMKQGAQEFEKETGIKVNAVRMSSGEVVNKLRAEKNNPQAAVWWGGPADGYIQAKEEGLLEQYASPSAKIIPDQFKDTEGYWTGIYIGYLGFASNKKLLDEKGVPVPQSWQDLLDPRLQGQVSAANPGSSGTAYTTLATVVQLMGEEQGLQYMKDLDGQIRSYQKSGTAPARMAGQGEAIVGITFMHDAIVYREQGMVDLVVSAPSEGTGYEIGGVALIKGGPNQEAAKKFIDWAISKNGQEIGQKTGSYQFLTNPEASQPAQADELKDTVLISYDFAWAGKTKQDLIEKWSKATGK
jgi:ABC-type Fe3+ transport system, periplasmic component